MCSVLLSHLWTTLVTSIQAILATSIRTILVTSNTGNARMEVPTIALFMSVYTQGNSCYAHSGSLTVRLSSSPLSSLPNYPIEGTFPLAKLDRYWPSCQNYSTCVQTVIPHQ